MLSSFVFSQEITVLDNISTKAIGTVYDFDISPTKERFYLVSSPCGDSLHFNGAELFLEDDCTGTLFDYSLYFLGVNPNSALSFLKKMGKKSGGRVITTDTSVLLFSYCATDTLLLTDTFFVKPIGAHQKTTSMAITEYSFDGELKRAKYWPWVNDCRYSISKVIAQNGDYYINGSFSNDTLVFDGQAAPMLTWGEVWTDIFTAKIDGTTWEYEWIRAHGGLGADSGKDWDVGNDGSTVATGHSESTQNFCDGDTVQTGALSNTDVIWLSKITDTGECDGFGDIKSFGIGESVGVFSDLSFMMTGTFYGTNSYFDGVVVENYSSPDWNDFIAMYNENNTLRFIEQFESEVSPSVRDIAITSEDAAWVTGGYLKDWSFNSFSYNAPAEDMDVFFMKLDKEGNPLYVTSFGGKKWDSGMQVRKGHDNNAYALVLTESDTITINGEEYYNDNFYGNLLVEIKDVATITEENIPTIIDIKTHPNPIAPTQNLNFEINDTTPTFFETIELYSLYGQVISSFNIKENKGSIQLPDLSAGMYFLHFKNGKNQVQHIEKIIVQ